MKESASDSTIASDGGGWVEKLNNQVKAVVYKSELDQFLVPIEKNSGMKRENILYGLLAFIALYLVVGKDAQLVCNLIGFSYPAFVCLRYVHKLKKSSTGSDDPRPIDVTQWLVYWSIFGALAVLDFYANSFCHVFPLYFLFKAIFLVYLYLPQTKGAAYVYVKFIDPAILTLDKTFDELTKNLKSL